MTGTSAVDTTIRRQTFITATQSIISKNRQRPVDESCELRLLPRARLGKDLLKLAPRSGQRHSRCIGGSLQAIALRNGYCHLRLTIG